LIHLRFIGFYLAQQTERQMKKIIIACLLMLMGQSQSFGASDCHIVQYPDTTEVTCTSSLSASRALSTGALPLSAAQIVGRTGTYATVQLAYDAAANDDVIRITGDTIPGPLLANNPSLSAVTLVGGCDASFNQIPGDTTTILGMVVVQNGRINMDSVKVRHGAPLVRLPVNLGSAGDFVILAKTGVSATGTTSVVGDIGLSPSAASFLTGFGLTADLSNTFSLSALVSGKAYASNYATPTPAKMTAAVSDMETAFNDAAGRTLPDFTELGAGDISGRTLVPGLYKWGTGVLITDAGVTLSGGANDVWIFQVAQDLTVSNSANVTLIGGAQAKNIFWQVAGQATLGTAADFKGIILSQTLISLNTGARMTGRALAQSAVTLNAAAISAP
jgi:hypothetical protein